MDDGKQMCRAEQVSDQGEEEEGGLYHIQTDMHEQKTNRRKTFHSYHGYDPPYLIDRLNNWRAASTCERAINHIRCEINECDLLRWTVLNWYIHRPDVHVRPGSAVLPFPVSDR